MIYLDAQKTVDLVANTLKNVEELVYQGDKAVVLQNFIRSCQINSFGCGACSCYSILSYLGKRCSLQTVERELRTDWEGTDVADIKRVLTKHGLKYQEKKHCRMCDLTSAIDDDSPILISTHDSWHYSVVFGYSRSNIFVMNPAIIGSCGSLFCRIPNKQFLEEWDRWAIVVSDA